MQLKEWFFKISFFYTWIPVKVLMRLSGKKYVHVFYHYISTSEKNELISALYKPKNKKQFQEDLSFLKKNFKPLTVHDFEDTVKNDLGFLISFDDGLTNFYDEVVPILKAQNITAINFINTGFIDNKALFFRYKVSLLLSVLEDKELTDSQQKAVGDLLPLERYSYNKLHLFLKSITIHESAILDQLAEIVNFSFKDYLKVQKPYMTSFQIQKLIDAGFFIGAHSNTHPRYSTIAYENQVKETQESIAVLENSFGLQKRLFAFPFSDDKVSLRFFDWLSDENIISFGTSGLKDDDIVNHHQRIQMEYENDIYTAETIIKGELVYYLFKKILGKHKTERV